MSQGYPISRPIIAINNPNPVMPESQVVDWGIKNLRIQEIHKKGITGNGIKVAVIDTGVDAEHVDLKPNIQLVQDFTGEGFKDRNDYFHGTHVAGIIAAIDSNQGMLGVAPNSSIYGMKSMREAGTGSTSMATKAIRAALDLNVDIISMSFGSTHEDKHLHAAIKEGHKKGVLFFSSAGNYGTVNSITYPSRWEEVIAIGAINQQFFSSAFSSQGKEIDFCAPGERILSTVGNDKYKVASGTSMAAPFAAGCAALCLEAGFLPGQIFELFKAHAIDIETTNFDTKSGWGVIDVYTVMAENVPNLPREEPQKQKVIPVSAIKETISFLQKIIDESK